MTKSNSCKMRECLSTHRRELVGAFLLLIATLLTVLTFSGIGIFGMFLTGVFLCCHKHMGCRCCGCCYDNEEDNSGSSLKKTTARKSSAKTAK